MIAEQELKDKCTKKFIDWLENLAEGFSDRHQSYEVCWFPLLIHRAVEGWNKKNPSKHIWIEHELVWHKIWSNGETDKYYKFKNYKPESLTHAECAMLDCLIDIFSEQEERDE